MKSSRTHLLIRQYLNEVKCLLPVLRREEIDYFQKMEANMYDLLENGDFEPPASMEDCHKIFGEPKELVHQYYSCVDMASYAASVNFRKMIRNIILSVCGVIMGIVFITCVIIWQDHQHFLKNELAIKTAEIIEEVRQ